MDEWIDKATRGRSNIEPNEIPWDALHKMLVQYVYGGRVDNKYDTARLEGFVEALFCPEAFNDEKESSVGSLGYVRPIVKGEQTQRETLARVVQVDDGKVKVVYMEKYMVIGKERVNLNATDEENWIAASAFRTQAIEMNR